MAMSSSHPARQIHQSDDSHSYTQMGPMDMDGVGAHCHLCRQQDFLPYQCQSCRHKFCGEHRTEDSHYCEKKGAWREAQLKKTQVRGSMLDVSNGRTIASKDEICAGSTCTTSFTARKPSSHCDQCNRKYCWAHRMPEDHNCKNLIPIGARPSFGASLPSKSSIMDRLRKSMKDSKINITAAKISMPVTGAKADKKKEFAVISKLKVDAKQNGDQKIGEDKRIYVFILGAANATINGTWHKESTFYSKEWTSGRILDLAAKLLKVPNRNNQTSKDNEKVGIFHWAKWATCGKVLMLNQTLADQGVTNGDSLILFKGVINPALDEILERVEL